MAGRGKVVVGFMLVARKHTKAAGRHETNGTLLGRWPSEGSTSLGQNAGSYIT